MSATKTRGLLLGVMAVLLAPSMLFAQLAQPAGPAAEKRFPPLKLPKGFKATLFACDPCIEYPSAICLGPRPGTLFVAVDYMTGLGTEIVRRDEIRLLEDTDGDGYADKVTVFATGFNSIMGLAYHDGTLYVSHAPYVTALRDTKGTGKADERRDLLSGVGLTPEKNPVRLHCANGVVMGHDNWLYIALGDNGCDIPRKGQKNLVLNGGGILRCRPDGSQVHVLASGLRNIYDVALDEDLNVFVRDNENDGGTYMIRVCHSFFGADHGYPYLYYERPEEAMPPIADLGLGSSAGGICYLETRFSEEYRGNLFFCEWGKSVVRCQLERSGSGFAKTKEIEFATGAAKDPYPFKPTDLVVDHDGALIVSDWCDGQRPKRGRARIYRITTDEKRPPLEQVADTLPGLFKQLDSESYHVRCAAQTALEKRGAEAMKPLREVVEKRTLGVRGRMHAVWVLLKGSLSVYRSASELYDIARSDPEPRVQVQALRALVDRLDPAFGDNSVAETYARELAEFAKGKDPRVMLEVIIAQGRLERKDAPEQLRPLLANPDPVLEHAAMQTLRRCNNWPAVMKLLDLPDKDIMRVLALRALADRAEPVIVKGLIERLQKEKDVSRRQEYADLLTRVHKKPGPWKYWGYRPPPRPVNTVAWERTEAIEEALDRVLVDPDGGVRLAILKRMQREKIPVRLETLSQWLGKESRAESVTAILEAMGAFPPAKVQPALTALIHDRKQATPNRLLALGLWVKTGDRTEASLSELAKALEDGPVLAEVLKHMGSVFTAPPPGLLTKLSSPSPEMRTAALEVSTKLGVAEAGKSVPGLLDDVDPRVRRAAAEAAGKLQVRAAIELLLKRAADADAPVRSASLDALRLLKEPRVVPLAVPALKDPATQLAALQCLTALGTASHFDDVVAAAIRHPSAEILTAAVEGLSMQSGDIQHRFKMLHAVAKIQGSTGALLSWDVMGPLAAKDVSRLLPQLEKDPLQLFLNPKEGLFATGAEARWPMAKVPSGAWLGHTAVEVAEPMTVQFLGSSNGTYRVWLNDKIVFERKQTAPFQPNGDRFSAKLDKGHHRIFVHLTPGKGPVDFHLHFRRTASKAEHEKLTEIALTKKGNPDRGSKVFFNIEKSNCLKCHRLGDKGERIGPDLTGVGSRFSRIYLIESILEPSRTIAPSFESVTVELKDGKLVIGVPVAETETQLTVADNQGLKHVLVKSAIAERRRHPVSTMPEGLEQRLTADEFVDLIAFLTSQKAGR